MTWTPQTVLAPFLTEPAVKEIMAVFGDAGHADAYRFVGGCSRNVLMDIEVADIDIATTLRPEQVREIFQRAGYNVHDTGLAHGTITVVVRGVPFEVTTLRKDVATDGRRAVIEYTTDWAEDALRRDFRCNAIYMDGHGKLYDYVGGGIRDALDRKLVFVGDAETRIREDYLRILRFFRFQATLGAQGDAEGLEACSRLKAGMSTLSGERLQVEMLKLLKASDPVPAVRSLVETGVFSEVVTLRGGMCMNTFERVCRATPDPEVRLAALFDWDSFAVELTFERWKVSNALWDRVHSAVDGCSVSMQRDDLRREIYRVGVIQTVDRMILTWAEEASPDMSAEDLHVLIEEVRSDVPVFPLRGQDVIDAGVKPGPAIGQFLKQVETWWINSGYPPAEDCRAHLRKLINA